MSEDVDEVRAELERLRHQIERVRAIHVPRDEIIYYRAGEPVRETVCSVCVYTGDDYDPAGNRFRVREHESWPCETAEAIGVDR
jgi:hypothetical protein